MVAELVSSFWAFWFFFFFFCNLYPFFLQTRLRRIILHLVFCFNIWIKNTIIIIIRHVPIDFLLFGHFVDGRDYNQLVLLLGIYIFWGQHAFHLKVEHVKLKRSVSISILAAPCFSNIKWKFQTFSLECVGLCLRFLHASSVMCFHVKGHDRQVFSCQMNGGMRWHLVDNVS